MVKSLLVYLKKPYLAIAYSLFVLFLCVMPSNNIPGNVDDKLAHFLAFGGVSFLWLWVKPKYLTVIPLAILFGVAIEIIQGLLPIDFYRSLDWYDALADGIGALIGAIGYFIFKRFISYFLKKETPKP